MIVTMGELLVEIMRAEEDTPLDRPAVFLGPYPSGAPAIFIDTAARLSEKTAVIGGVGNDDFGKCLLERLTGDGVDCRFVTRDQSGLSTGCAFVTYFRDGSRKFIFHIANTPAAKAVMPPAEMLPRADFFHVMGCSLMADRRFGEEILKTARAYRDMGARISFDPNVRPELLGDGALISEILSMTNVFLPGVSELLAVTGCTRVDAAVRKCFENPNLSVIALKDGARGCRVYTREESFAQGIYAVEVNDPTGAGDAFDAAFVVGLSRNMPLREIAKYASAAAALNTAAFGPMEGKISEENVRDLILENEVTA